MYALSHGSLWPVGAVASWHIATWIALLLLLAGKARWEERMLRAKHPESAEYAARVGRFVPGIGRLRRSG